jgi:hypothetical protein
MNNAQNNTEDAPQNTEKPTRDPRDPESGQKQVPVLSDSLII